MKMHYFDIVTSIPADLTPHSAIEQFEADQWVIGDHESGYDGKYVTWPEDEIRGPHLTFFFQGNHLLSARTFSHWTETEALVAAGQWGRSIEAKGATEEQLSASEALPHYGVCSFVQCRRWTFTDGRKATLTVEKLPLPFEDFPNRTMLVMVVAYPKAEAEAVAPANGEMEAA